MSLYALDEEFRRQGFSLVGGVDEVGRGPFAGPLVACVCTFPSECTFDELNDSKKLNKTQRQRIYNALVRDPRVSFSLGLADVATIDRLGVHKAAFFAMEDAYLKMKKKPDCLLVDGPHPVGPKITAFQKPIVQGDSKSAVIAAASIIAKVRRDWIMSRMHLLYPEYGFDTNQGYGTKDHKEALEKYGPTLIHRTSFKPVQLAMK